MENYIANLLTLARKCDCGNHHNPIPIEKIVIANRALEEAVSFIEKKHYKHAVLIADEKTFLAAGGNLSHQLTNANIEFSISLIQPDENNDVTADEKSLVQALLEIPAETDVIVAIGAGTIHDIARFCSSKTRVPFISVPTAPSVDGFTSMGAPLIIRGVKTTFQMTAPIAVFADIAVLKAAPRKMIAAGFGDMLAKFTSLADWKFGHLIKGEPYCPLAAEITREALQTCVDNAEEIEKSNQNGIRILIEALIQSGLAMLLFGQSHPASGGEHHLSHYWEMEFLQRKWPAVLHGAKVGVSSTLLCGIYKKQFLHLITDAKIVSGIKDKEIQKNIKDNIREITVIYDEIPTLEQLREYVAKLGGPVHPEELGINEDLVKRSLNEAYQLRNRFTALKFIKEYANVQPKYVSETS